MATVLRGLKRADLESVAQATNLPNYEENNVGELRTRLDEYLKTNATTYNTSGNELVKAYYEKAGLTPKSPVKKSAEKVQDLVSGDDAAAGPIVKKRRKTTTAPVEDAKESASALVKASSNGLRAVERRSSTILQQTADAVAVSPKRVAEAFDQQISRPIQAQVSDVLQRLQVAEYTDIVRDWASSPYSFALLSGVFEANLLRRKVIPIVWYSYSRAQDAQRLLPFIDVFKILETSFWAPVSLWATTSIFLPLLAAYFINIPLKVQPGHNYGTRRATSHASATAQFDPFMYFVAKALISYLVYANHTLFYNPFSNFTMALVNENMYEGYSGILVTSAIGALLSLYEAVLRK